MIFPFTFEKEISSNARNWPLVIVMNPKAKFKTAIWMQECYESNFKTFRLGMFKNLFSKKSKMKMEIMGHEIEVLAMAEYYGYNLEQLQAYRVKEATTMKNNYNGLFDSYDSIDDLVEAMKDRTESARKWLKNKDKMGKKVFKKLG